MEPNLLFILLVFGLSCLVFFAFLAIFVVVIIFAIRSGAAWRKKFNERPDKMHEEYLAAATLRSWGPEAWTDLSSRWEGWWHNTSGLGRIDGYEQAIVKSHQDPKGPGWIAFTIERHEARSGPVILKTSGQRIELQVTSKGISDRNLQVITTIDGVEDGSIAVTYPNCTYHSKDGAVEAHWVAEWRMKSEVNALGRLISRDVRYDVLTVNGRAVASITDTWIRNPHPESTKPIPAALQSVSPDLTPVEQNILLIALGLALHYDSLRNRELYTYDW